MRSHSVATSTLFHNFRRLVQTERLPGRSVNEVALLGFLSVVQFKLIVCEAAELFFPGIKPVKMAVFLP